MHAGCSGDGAGEDCGGSSGSSMHRNAAGPGCPG